MKTISPLSFEPAKFEGYADFEHFENKALRLCFFCNSRGMAVRPLQVTPDYVLLPATTRVDGPFVIIPGCWLVVPRAHVTSHGDLPDNWTASVKEAVSFLGLSVALGKPYNITENWGSDAGQTAQHAHTWIVSRGNDEEGLLSARTGLASILLRIKERGVLA